MDRLDALGNSTIQCLKALPRGATHKDCAPHKDVQRQGSRRYRECARAAAQVGPRGGQDVQPHSPAQEARDVQDGSAIEGSMCRTTVACRPYGWGLPRPGFDQRGLQLHTLLQARPSTDERRMHRQRSRNAQDGQATDARQGCRRSWMSDARDGRIRDVVAPGWQRRRHALAGGFQDEPGSGRSRCAGMRTQGTTPPSAQPRRRSLLRGAECGVHPHAGIDPRGSPPAAGDVQLAAHRATPARRPGEFVRAPCAPIGSV